MADFAMQEKARKFVQNANILEAFRDTYEEGIRPKPFMVKPVESRG